MVSKCWSDTPAISGSTALLLQQTVYAFAFVPSADQYLHAMRWYRSQAGASQHPDALMLWDTTTQTTVAYTGSPADDGSVGWQQTNVGSQIVLVSGREYRVGIYLLGGSIRTANYTTTNPADAADDLDHAATKYRYIQNTYGYPSLTASGYYCAVDVVTDDTPPDPDSGIDVGDVRNLFASWLSSGGDNTHTDDGLPWLTKVAVDAIQTVTDDLPATLTDLGDDIGTVLTRTAGLTGGAIQSALDALQTALKGAGSATLTALADTLAALESSLGAVGNILGLLAGGPSGMAVNTDPGWVEVDSGAFSGPFAVTERCDRIYVHITTVGSANATSDILGRDFGTFAWWWCPIFANMQGRYHTSRAREAALYEPGMRMDGALIVVPDDFEGTYSAARFDG